MSPRYVMRKNLRRTSPGCPGMLCATKTLTFKTRVSAKSLWCKGVLFAWEYEIFFKPIPLHLASLWHWALEQLSNCQFSLYLYCYLFPFFYFSLVFQHVGYHKNSNWTRLPERRKNKSPARKISLLQLHKSVSAMIMTMTMIMIMTLIMIMLIIMMTTIINKTKAK